ncbi:MAG TPA: ABC transporter permease subunit [Candidatus Dormibacteraeota bacterium]|jgi:ABC-2 type transport system permease protein
MFRSVYLKTLRDYRVPILGWGLGMGALMLTIFTAFPSVVATPEARASVVALGPSFAWIAEPIKLDTPGGYATWKYGLTLLVVVLWPILAHTGMLRGEEDRGSMNVLLSLPRGRVRVALEKVAAMWTALVLMAVIIGLMAYTGAAKVNAGLSLPDAVLFGVNLAVIGAFFGSLGLVVSQFTQERRPATGITSGLLLVFIVIDMVHRVIPNTEWLSRLSPVYYFNLSKPLVPGYGPNPGAMAFLVAMAAVMVAGGVWLFSRRDIGGVVPLPAKLHLPRRASQSERSALQGGWSLRSVYSRSLAVIAAPTFWWTLAIAGLGGWMVVIVKQAEVQLNKLLQGSPLMQQILHVGGSGGTSATILSSLFIFLPLLLMAFAVTQASRWAADEEDGRLELVLSTPQPRLSVLMARFAALATATVVIALVTLAVTVVASGAEGVRIDDGNLSAAILSMVPMGLLVAALGYLFAGWLRAAFDTGLLSFLLVIWFFISFVGPGLSWPEATQRLSAFYYYGTPLLNGLPVWDTVLVIAVAATALALAAARFVRKDIAV